MILKLLPLALPLFFIGGDELWNYLASFFAALIWKDSNVKIKERGPKPTGWVGGQKIVH